MNGKADIAFLLNPKAQAQMLSCHTPEPRTQYIIATPPATPPPMSLFRSLSPVARFPERVALSLSPTRKMQASYESVHQKRFSNVRCYGDDNTRLPLLSLAAMYAASSSNSSRNASPASSVASSKLSEEERSSASSRPSSQVQGGKTRVRMTRTPPCQVEGEWPRRSPRPLFVCDGVDQVRRKLQQQHLPSSTALNLNALCQK
ncbi:hypothetical protein PRIC2_004380 [Phytophthora ramorum]